jgi:hypothetical protein
MAPHLLKFDHGSCHIERGDLLPRALMTDVVVLTENTTEIAVGQENGPRAMRTDQRRLFAKVGKGARDRQF